MCVWGGGMRRRRGWDDTLTKGKKKEKNKSKEINSKKVFENMSDLMVRLLHV